MMSLFRFLSNLFIAGNSKTEVQIYKRGVQNATEKESNETDKDPFH
jgi:hypothetical protein